MHLILTRDSGTIALQLRESTENFVIPAAQGMIAPEQSQRKDAGIICQLLPGRRWQVALHPLFFLLLFCRGEGGCWWQYLSHWLKSLDHYSGAQAHGMIGAVSLSVPQHLTWKTQDILMPSEWRHHSRARSSYSNKVKPFSFVYGKNVISGFLTYLFQT